MMLACLGAADNALGGIMLPIGNSLLNMWGVYHVNSRWCSLSIDNLPNVFDVGMLVDNPLVSIVPSEIDTHR